MSAIIYSWFFADHFNGDLSQIEWVNIPCNDAFDEIDKTLSSFYKKFNKIVEQARTYGNRFLYSNAELKKLR